MWNRAMPFVNSCQRADECDLASNLRLLFSSSCRLRSIMSRDVDLYVRMSDRQEGRSGIRTNVLASFLWRR
jgi:hypothetical protein